jgi:hypothetical protein
MNPYSDPGQAASFIALVAAAGESNMGWERNENIKNNSRKEKEY